MMREKPEVLTYIEKVLPDEIEVSHENMDAILLWYKDERLVLTSYREPQKVPYNHGRQCYFHGGTKIFRKRKER